VVVGAAVILLHPTFQGPVGEIASLLLSRMTVPVLYYVVNKRKKIPLDLSIAS
jgi:hypothetical protein